MDIITGISVVLAITFAVLYYANGKKANMAMDVAKELRKRLDEAEKQLSGKPKKEKPIREHASSRNNEEVQNLKARLSIAERDCKSLQERLRMKESTVESIRKSKESLQKQDEEKSAEIESLKAEIQNIAEENNRKTKLGSIIAQVRTNRLNKALEEKDCLIEMMKKGSMQDVMEEVAKKDAELKEQSKFISALEDSNSVLQSDLELIREELEGKNQIIESLEKNNTSEKEVAESKNTRFNERISELEREISEKERELSSSKRDQKFLENELKLQLEKNESLEEQIGWMSVSAKKTDEADKILKSAKKEADSIIKEANDKAETILEQANSSAEVIRVNARMHYTSERERMEQTVQWQEEKLKKIEQQSEALIAQAYGTRKVIMEGVDVDEFLLANGMYNNLRANILSDDLLTDLGGEVSNLRKKLKANIAAQKKFKKENGGSAAYMKGSRETNFFYTGATTFGTMTFDVMSENIISAVPTEGLEKSLEKVNNLKNICEYHMHSNGNKGLFYTDYIRLKLEELKLVSDIHVLREAKKEEQRRERQRLADEMKAQKDFEREIKRAQKDEEEARKALERAELEAAKEKANKERFVKLQEQIEKLKSALKEAEERGQRILSMAQQTRRGWVYIISNIGSFGEGVYKIGLTRRLDPMERVYELGDASVPFPFDVHAFIFSEDAPALETALHQAFDKYKVNSVNWRKEYFKVSLDAIKRKVAELGYEVDWEDYAYAPQFRDSVLKK